VRWLKGEQKMRKILGFVSLGLIGFIVLWGVIVSCIYNQKENDTLTAIEYDKNGKTFVTETDWNTNTAIDPDLTDENRTARENAVKIYKINHTAGSKETVGKFKAFNRTIKHYELEIERIEAQLKEDIRKKRIDYDGKDDPAKAVIDAQIIVLQDTANTNIATAEYNIKNQKDQKGDARWAGFKAGSTYFWSFFGLQYNGIVLVLLSGCAFYFLSPKKDAKEKK
jgi:hypothetical protein